KRTRRAVAGDEPVSSVAVESFMMKAHVAAAPILVKQLVVGQGHGAAGQADKELARGGPTRRRSFGEASAALLPAPGEGLSTRRLTPCYHPRRGAIMQRTRFEPLNPPPGTRAGTAPRARCPGTAPPGCPLRARCTAAHGTPPSAAS